MNANPLCAGGPDRCRVCRICILSASVRCLTLHCQRLQARQQRIDKRLVSENSDSDGNLSAVSSQATVHAVPCSPPQPGNQSAAGSATTRCVCCGFRCTEAPDPFYRNPDHQSTFEQRRRSLLPPWQRPYTSDELHRLHAQQQQGIRRYFH